MTLLNHTWHHIRRSPFQSLTAVTVIFVSFLAFSFFAIISSGFSRVLNYFETKPEITIFLKDGLSKETVEEIQNNLATFPDVREIKFISKEKALALYQEQNKNNPILTEMVTANILPASFEISVSNPSTLEKISNEYKNKTNLIDEIIYQKDVVKTLLGWTKTIRQVGLAVVSLLGLISFTIIFVLIGMKITSRKDEIRISRLLGASKFYVKKPFLLEGTIYGLVGSSLGAAIGILSSLYFGPQINRFFNPVTFISRDLSFYIFIFTLELSLGVFVGFFASFIGTKRYIKF